MDEIARMDTPLIPTEERLAVQVCNLTLTILPKKRLLTSLKSKKKESRAVVKGLSCSFHAGRLTAVMGPSGAGKTTLLRHVAGDRLKRISSQGSVLLNGKPVSEVEMKEVSGFVFQDDVILPTMTVREAIAMAAKLKGGSGVDQVMRLLGLTHVADTVIGEPAKKGISGGERKRVCIGMQLVTDPPVLFLDEPTSGLDAYTACSVISYLKQLTKQGRTVITTIHQPSSKLYHMFDDILLLADGRVVYEGGAETAIDYFADRGFPCPQFVNPADHFFLEVLRHGDPERISMLIDAWQAQSKQVAAEKFSPLTVGVKKRVGVSFGTQFAFLLTRAAKNMRRNKMILQLRAIRAIFFGSLVAAIYYDTGAGKDGEIQNRVSSLYFLLTNEFFGSVGTVISIFTTERPVFIREHRSGYYGVLAYFLSKLLVELPLQLVFPVVTMSIPYYFVGYQKSWPCYLTAVGIFVLVSNASAAVGILLGGLFVKIETALAAMPMILLPLMIFSGLLVNLANVPWYFIWLKHLSPVKRAFVALAKNEFSGSPIGEQALQRYSIDKEPSIGAELSVLSAMYVVLLIFAFLGLFRIAHMRK